MPGLCDSVTGLEFGDSLQFQAPIGGAGLTIEASGPIPPAEALLWGGGNDLEWGAGNILVWG